MQEIEAQGYWFAEIMYPTAGNAVTGILAIFISLFFLLTTRTVAVGDREYVDSDRTACLIATGYCFTIGSVLLMLVLTMGQKDGEMML